jgi:hypothetical protein
MEEEAASVTLSTPLLSTANSTGASEDKIRSQIGTMSAQWPGDDAERVKLYIPQDYDPYQDERNPGKCFLHLDQDRNVLAVISESTGETLDVIDPNDIIGVKLEIELSPGGGGTPLAADGIATDLQFTSFPGKTNTLDHREMQHLVDHRERPQSAVAADSLSLRPTNEPVSETPVDRQARAVLNVYVYPRRDLSKVSILSSCFAKKKPKPNVNYPPLPSNATASDSSTPIGEQSTKYGHRYQHHRRFTVAPVEDFSDISAMVNAIRNLASPSGSDSSCNERRLLVISNPKSGLQKADEIYATTLRPMLEEAGVEHDYVVTTHAGHAKELMQEQSTIGGTERDLCRLPDLLEYTGIVCVGGDGLVYEVIQGIHGRSDKKEIFKTVKLGIVGAGTSNGLSATLAHASEVRACCCSLSSRMGRKLALTLPLLQMILFLILSRKEKCSPLDSSFVVAKGNSCWLDLSEYQTTSKSYTSFLTFSWSIIAEIDIESEIIRFMGFIRMDLWGAWRTVFLRKYRARFSYLPPTEEKRMVKLPPLNEPFPENEGWVTAEDTFILFWASHVSHAGESMFHTPQSTIDDGVFTIFIVRYVTTTP